MKKLKDGSLDLDSKDLVLLSLLQQDGQLSLSEIGRRVNLTKMAVSNRIKNLRKAGIIEGFFCKLNPEKLMQDYVVITQVICRPKGPKQEQIANTIAKLPGVQSVYQVFGSFDILIIARRSDRDSARRLIYEVSRIPGVSNTITTVPNNVIKESLVVDIRGTRKPSA